MYDVQDVVAIGLRGDGGITGSSASDAVTFGRSWPGVSCCQQRAGDCIHAPFQGTAAITLVGVQSLLSSEIESRGAIMRYFVHVPKPRAKRIVSLPRLSKAMRYLIHELQRLTSLLGCNTGKNEAAHWVVSDCAAHVTLTRLVANHCELARDPRCRAYQHRKTSFLLSLAWRCHRSMSWTDRR